MKSSMRTFTLGLATCETLNKASKQPSADPTLPTSVCGGLTCKPRPATRFDKLEGLDFRHRRARCGAGEHIKTRGV